MTHTIRPFQPADLPALHTINIMGEPGLGALSEEGLGKLVGISTCFVIADAEGKPFGFLLALEPDADYASKNYQWFDERFEDFVYVDRIAIHQTARGQGFGTALYEYAFEAFSGQAFLMGCEVNTAPANPGSMRFHERLSFGEVGAQSFTPDYAVAYLARRLSK